LPDLIAAADLVICQAGYNTLGEVQAAGTPAIVVPAQRGLDDQNARAQEATRSGGPVRLLEADDVGTLAELIDESLNAGAHRPPAAPAMQGASRERAAALLRNVEMAEVRRRRTRSGRGPLVVDHHR
jgi:UDP-N-acetylglucosamine:LPS N-acetylglucosamine transferase